MQFFNIHIVKIVSSISARKLMCPSSARLGLEPSQLGLARARKFQLELISSRNLDFDHFLRHRSIAQLNQTRNIFWVQPCQVGPLVWKNSLDWVRLTSKRFQIGSNPKMYLINPNQNQVKLGYWVALHISSWKYIIAISG